MTSIKKIALGVVAAITFGSLIASPASAAVSTTLTVGGSAPATAGTTSATAIALPVPADNSVDSADALKISLSGLDTGTTVSAVANGGKIVSALATVAAPVTASAGSSTISIATGTGTTAEFYVFTTSTATGSIAVTVAGNTTTYYFAGTAGTANKIAITSASSGAAGTVYTAKVAAVDVFGNAKGGVTVTLRAATATGETTYTLVTDTAVATVGTKTQDLTLPASGTVRLTAQATVASAVTNLDVPVGYVTTDVTVRDLAAELSVVQAQLAAEKAAHAADLLAAQNAKALADINAAKAAADLATANSALAKANADNAVALKAVKDAFNALAKKWNAKNPKTKVATLK